MSKVVYLCHQGCHILVFAKTRWKGENVATTEVADNLLMVDCIEEANVYGVKVPGKMLVGIHLLLKADKRGKTTSVL